MVKKKWQGNILLIFVFTGLLPSSKRGRGPAYLLGEDHLILTGIWKIFLGINILARSWVKIKINMLSHNEAKYSINRQLDNKWKIYLKNVACNHQDQGGFIQKFFVNKFEVLPLCYPCHCVILAIVLSLSLCYPCFELSSPNFYTNITYQFSGPFNIKKNKRARF